VAATNTRPRPLLGRLLHQAAIDPDFRAELEASPGAFGAADDPFELPVSVQRQDDTFREALGDGMGAADIFACISTCSNGPITIVCEGNTKVK